MAFDVHVTDWNGLVPSWVYHEITVGGWRVWSRPDGFAALGLKALYAERRSWSTRSLT